MPPENTSQYDVNQPSHLESKLSDSEKMKQHLLFKPELPSEEERLNEIAKKIPFFTELLRNFNFSTSSSLAELNVQDTSALAGLHWGGVALAAIDFFRIPAVYLACAVTGEKPPISLTNNGRWVYSAVLLGLTVTALALPMVALPMAMAIASLTFGFGIYSLGKALYARAKARNELKAVNQQIIAETRELNILRHHTITLEQNLRLAETNQDEIGAAKIREELKVVQALFKDTLKEKQTILQELCNKKFHCEEILKKKETAINDKSVATFLLSLSVVGLGLSFIFPPVGLGIFAASTGLAGLYATVRIIQVGVKWLRNKVSSKTKLAEQKSPIATHTDFNHELSNYQSLSPKLSTAEAMNKLFGEKTKPKEDKQSDKEQFFRQQHEQLKEIMAHQNPKELLNFFNQVALYIQSNPHFTLMHVRQLFSKIHAPQDTFTLFQQAISSEHFSEEIRNNLLKTGPLRDFLLEKEMPLLPLAEKESKAFTPPSLTASEPNTDLKPRATAS